MTGEVRDRQHLVAQRRHEQQIHLREHARHLRRQRGGGTDRPARNPPPTETAPARNRFGHASGTCTFSVSSAAAERQLLERRRRLAEEHGHQRAVRPVGQAHLGRPSSPACARSRARRGRRRSPGSPSSTPGSSRRAGPFTGAVASKSRWLGTLDTSPASGPVIACSTSIASSTLRVIGPSLSSDQHSVIAPVRGTRPNVGRRPGDAAAHRRRDDAAAGFAADREADQPGRRRRARAGARSRRALFEQPRVHRLAAEPDVVERERAQAQLGDEHRAGVVQTTHDRGVGGRHAVAERLGAVGRRRCRRCRADPSRRTECRAAARDIARRRSPRRPASPARARRSLVSVMMQRSFGSNCSIRRR